MIHLEHKHLEALRLQTAKENNLFCGDSFYCTSE